MRRYAISEQLDFVLEAIRISLRFVDMRLADRLWRRTYG